MRKAHGMCRKKTIVKGIASQEDFGTKLLSRGRHLGHLTGTWRLSTNDTGQWILKQEEQGKRKVAAAYFISAQVINFSLR